MAAGTLGKLAKKSVFTDCIFSPPNYWATRTCHRLLFHYLSRDQNRKNVSVCMMVKLSNSSPPQGIFCLLLTELSAEASITLQGCIRGCTNVWYRNSWADFSNNRAESICCKYKQELLLSISSTVRLFWLSLEKGLFAVKYLTMLLSSVSLYEAAEWRAKKNFNCQICRGVSLLVTHVINV